MTINTDALQITPDILALIAEIDEFKGAWKALSILEPERLSALKHIATIESIGSSTRMEGSQLTNSEIENLLANVNIKRFDTRDEQEVIGYADLMLVFDSWQDIPLTEGHIKQLHRDLLRYSKKDGRHRGHYKTASNRVAAFDKMGKQTGIIFETATPFDTPRLMQELILWCNEALETQRLHRLLIIALFIVIFLEIHPFQDGNGRLSRVLTTLLLLRASYHYVPYSSLESVIEQHKESYYLALRKTQRTIRTSDPDWQPWLLFFFRSLKQQSRRLSQKTEQANITLSTLPDLSIQILEYTREHGRVTMSQMMNITGSSRNTLKMHFRSLVKKKYLVMQGHGRGVWYRLAGLLQKMNRF